jgi:hypothetical protein
MVTSLPFRPASFSAADILLFTTLAMSWAVVALAAVRSAAVTSTVTGEVPSLAVMALPLTSEMSNFTPLVRTFDSVTSVPVCFVCLVAPKVPSSSFCLPKAVVEPIRSSSAFSCDISLLAAAAASESVAPEFDAWTDRSRMRWRIEVTSLSEPSAVCATLTPSWVLRTATLMPPICERRPSEIERPAASSAARLMRKPLDSFSRDFDIWLSVTDRFR